MYLNEEEQGKITQKKLIYKHKKKKTKKWQKYYYNFSKYSQPSNEDKNGERISLTEHSIILNEYEKELNFLSQKRSNSNENDAFSLIKEESTNKSNIIICVNDKNPIKKRGKKKKYKKRKVIKMSKLFNLYQNLFTKSGLDCKKPSRFVDYIYNDLNGNEDNTLNNDNIKINFEEIKKLALDLDGEETENVVINKMINDYFHCNFENCIMEKLIKKINKYLIENNNYIEPKNNDNLNILNTFNDNVSLSINTDTYEKSSKIKKDKFSYSNLLVEKLKNNNYKSCLSLSNDTDYFKSIIYLSNKFLQNNNQKIKSDKIIVNSLEENMKLIKGFKEENKDKANENDRNILNDILSNKNLKNYINKKFCFKEIFNNPILKILDKNNYHKIINILINNKKEHKNKLDILGIFNDSQIPQNEKNDNISLFKILFHFIIDILNIYKSPNNLTKNDFTIINSVMQYFKQIESNSKIKNKRIKLFKNIEKNKIKIDNEIIKNNINLKEEKKTENINIIKNENMMNKDKKSQIIKIFLDDNDGDKNLLKNEIKDNKSSLSLRIDIPKKESSKKIIIDNNDKMNTYNNSNLSNKNSNFINKDNIKIKLIDGNNKQGKKDINIFHKRILEDLEKGNDIFKLSVDKFKQKKVKEKEQIIKGKEKLEKINIEIREEVTKIKNENNNNIKINDYNKIENIFLQKKGNKIIIYDDGLSEENKNDSNNDNFGNNFKDNNLYYESRKT